MKKFYAVFLTFLCFLCVSTKANAGATDYVPHKITVQFNESFSTKNPPKTVSVVVTKDFTVKDSKTVEKGTVIYLDVTKVTKEKIGKMDATAEAKITKVYIPSEDRVINVAEINPNAIVKFSKYEKLDVTDKAIDTGISVANHFVSNIAYPAHFVKGAIKNESGNRLKSGLHETYDSSVFSYASTGEPLILSAGDLATLTYFTKNIHPQDNVVTEEEEQSDY